MSAALGAPASGRLVAMRPCSALRGQLRSGYRRARGRVRAASRRAAPTFRSRARRRGDRCGRCRARPATAELHRVDDGAARDPCAHRRAGATRRARRRLGMAGGRDGAAGTKDFARAVGNMIALSMGETPAAVARETRTLATPVAAVAGRRSFEAELRLRDIDPAVMEAEVYPGVSVMAVHLTDPRRWRCALHPGDARSPTRSSAPCRRSRSRTTFPISNSSATRSSPAGGGFEPPAAYAAMRIADAAVAMRERCLSLFEESDQPPEFRIGLDHGIAIGQRRRQRASNLQPVGRGGDEPPTAWPKPPCPAPFR